MNGSFLHADWPAHARVKTLITTRPGGVSEGPWSSFNLGLNCGDSSDDVQQNRRSLQKFLPSGPAWLKQVHGDSVLDWSSAQNFQSADGIIASQANQVCAVLSADCLPVLLSDVFGNEVAAVHAGWRGLASGIIANAINQMKARPDDIVAWLGPAISQQHYQVGEDLRSRFMEIDPMAVEAFSGDGDRWKADLYKLARQQLNIAGVMSIHGGDLCTYSEPDRFFSYRRDGQTGRMASLIWLGNE